MKTIVINNPSASMGGALVLLKQLLKYISSQNNSYRYIVFVSVKELERFSSDFVKIICLPKQALFRRILWDKFLFNRYLLSHNINPSIILSLQNTPLYYSGDIPQVVYFHQGLSVTDEKCNFFVPQERTFWFYKFIYPIFIYWNLDSVTAVITQTHWVKQRFGQKFSFSMKNIHVIPPEFYPSDVSEFSIINSDKFRFFFPAGPSKYKNHRLIIDVLALLVKERPDIVDRFECIFTFKESDSIELVNYIKTMDLKDSITLVGETSYEETLFYYLNSDCLLFPSLIETYGLPLKEAAYYGLSIVAVDKPYSREVLNSYDYAHFCADDDIDKWKHVLTNLILHRRAKTLGFQTTKNQNGWKSVVDLLINSIENRVDNV